MRFQVLGAFEVFDDSGVRLSLGSRRQRMLLAGLLAAHGGAVSAERLADLVWSGDPPPSSKTTLRGLVHQLRRLIGPERIVSRPGGYALIVRPGEVDVDRFESLVASARAADEADSAGSAVSAVSAVSLFEQALSLWGGEPYDGLLPSEADRLDELYLVVREELLESEISRGRHVEVVPELLKLVAQHPMRERFRAQLMLSLYRSGRASDALDVYRDMRALFARELGVEPSAELGELQSAILAEDQSLGQVRSTATSAEPVSTPAQLPPDLQTFVGRVGELARVCDALTGVMPAVIAIEGPGGIGKSALAAHAAHSVARFYPDGVLYADLRGVTPGLTPLKPIEAIGRFLRSLGVPSDGVPASQDEAVTRLSALVAGRNLLVLLDNASGPEQVRPLLTAVQGCGVIVTSRHALTTLNPAHSVQLDGLGDNEATELLGQLVGVDRVGSEPHAATEIIEYCGSLPLAVRIAGARLSAHAHWTLASLATKLADSRRRLTELAYADLAVRTSFDVGLADQHPLDAKVFALLGLLDVHDYTADVVGALAEVPAAEAETTLDRLVEAHLVDRSANGRYLLHDLLRLYAKELAERQLAEEERRKVIRRGMHFYLATARIAYLAAHPEGVRRAEAAIPPGQVEHAGRVISEPGAGMDWYDSETDNLIALARQASNGVERAEPFVIALAAVSATQLQFLARWTQSVELHSIAVSAATACGDQVGVARSRTDLGDVLGELGRFDAACDQLNQSLEIWRQLGERHDESNTLNALGAVLGAMGDYDRAIQCGWDALAIRDELGIGRKGPNLNNLGLFYRAQGRHQDALDAFQEALADHRLHGNVRRQGIALANIGETLRRTGRLRDAVMRFDEALRIARTSGARRLEVEVLWNFGLTLFEVSEANRARSYCREALLILEEMNEVTPSQRRSILSDPVPETPEVILRITG